MVEESAAPDTYTAADVLSVLALEDVAAALEVAEQAGVVVDVALMRRGAVLAPHVKLVRSARFSYRGDDTIAQGVARNLAHRAPHSAFLRLPLGVHAGAPLYCWVGLRRRYHARR